MSIVRLSRERGFTLVELMVALVLGLIVVGSALAVFLSQRVSNTLAAQMSDIQSDGRISLDALARDVRAAGDFGCWPVTSPIDKRLNNDAAFVVDDGGLRGFDSASALSSSSLTYAGASVVKTALNGSSGLSAGSSVLVVTGIFGALTQMDADMATQADALSVKTPVSKFNVGDVAVVTDCINWAKFEITGITERANAAGLSLAHEGGTHAATYGNGNEDGNIGELFGVGSRVGSLDHVWWFIGTVGGKSGLYRLSARDATPVLVSERVVAMRLAYDLAASLEDEKITTTGVAAAAVASTSWPLVRRAHVDLLLKSGKTVKAGEQTVTSFGGMSVPNDGYLYLPVSLSVALRNQ